jgi:NAD(P)-dependent dehydrogenase (short-subunit alcohol dehydrogenase family)
MSALDGRVALVTGASRGIGLAIATAMHEEGATVVLTDINAEGVAAAAAPLERGHALTCNVTKEAEVQAAVDRTVAEFGGLDIAVANAGVVRVQPLTDTSLDDWRQTTSVNIDGVFLTRSRWITDHHVIGLCLREHGSDGFLCRV